MTENVGQAAERLALLGLFMLDGLLLGSFNSSGGSCISGGCFVLSIGALDNRSLFGLL